VLLWDPDGDRLNVATRAPATFRESAASAGLRVDDRSIGDQCIVYFSPNQLYLLLAALRIQVLREAGRLRDRDWFVGLSYPTTMSLEELAKAESLNCVRVPVGFKYFGSLCAEIERQLNGDEVVFETTTGERVHLGKNPRALILCEESGGGTLGGAELLTSRTGNHSMLALREKDAMQLGLLSLCLGAKLYMTGTSFAEHYCDIVSSKGLKCVHYSRADVLLYNEALTGSALRAAKEEGVKRRDRVMDFFGHLADEHKAGRRSLQEIRQAIVDRAPQYADRLPALTRACRAGDDLLHGMLFEAENLRFLVRASGTDALLRYYVESADSATVDGVQEMLRSLKI
jgi:phosphomannomutase